MGLDTAAHATMAQMQSLTSEGDREALKALWSEKIRPIVQDKLRSCSLPGAYDMTYTTLRRYDDVRLFLKYNMMPTNETSKHINLPALTNTVARTVPFESSDQCTMALVAAAVWELSLCDKRQWMNAHRTSLMYVSGEFFDNITQYQMVPRGRHLPSRVPTDFRARLVVTAAMLSRCVKDEPCAARFRFRVAGLDYVIGDVYDYFLWVCEQLRSGIKTSTRAASVATPHVISSSSYETAALATTIWDCVELEPYDTVNETSLHFRYEWAVVTAAAMAILDHHVYYSGLTPNEVGVLRTAQCWDNLQVFVRPEFCV